MADDRIFIADRIMKRRFRSGNAQYYVKWKGCPSSYNTWEPENNILDPGLILEFEARLADALSKGKRPGRKPKLLKLKAVDFKGRPFDSNSDVIIKGKANWHGNKKDIPDEVKDNPLIENRGGESDQTSPKAIDINNNVTTEYPRDEKWKIPRKPKSLFLEQSIRDNSTINSSAPHFLSRPNPFGAFDKADSPLMGMVPSPIDGPNCEVDCAKDSGERMASPGVCDRTEDQTHNALQNTHITTFEFSKYVPTKTDGNSVKLGKFALLRKYRNSLEESDPITTTDVTVEGVTVTVRESDRPQGFFGPSTPKPWCNS